MFYKFLEILGRLFLKKKSTPLPTKINIAFVYLMLGLEKGWLYFTYKLEKEVRIDLDRTP